MNEYAILKEYLDDELDEQLSVFSVSHLLSKLSDYNRVILENGISGTLLFRGQSDVDFGVDGSIFRNGLLAKETALVNELILQEPREFGSHMTDFEQLVKMQHYGLPTRLLDITVPTSVQSPTSYHRSTLFWKNNPENPPRSSRHILQVQKAALPPSG